MLTFQQGHINSIQADCIDQLQPYSSLTKKNNYIKSVNKTKKKQKIKNRKFRFEKTRSTAYS